MGFLRRCSRSFAGNLVLVGVPFFVAESIVGIMSNLNEGSLTPGWTVRILIVCTAGAVTVTLLVWFSVTKPLLRRKER